MEGLGLCTMESIGAGDQIERDEIKGGEKGERGGMNKRE